MLEISANLILGKMRRLASTFSQLRRRLLSVTVEHAAARFRITVHKPESEGLLPALMVFAGK